MTWGSPRLIWGMVAHRECVIRRFAPSYRPRCSTTTEQGRPPAVTGGNQPGVAMLIPLLDGRGVTPGDDRIPGRTALTTWPEEPVRGRAGPEPRSAGQPCSGGHSSSKMRRTIMPVRGSSRGCVSRGRVSAASTRSRRRPSIRARIAMFRMSVSLNSRSSVRVVIVLPGDASVARSVHGWRPPG